MNSLDKTVGHFLLYQIFTKTQKLFILLNLSILVCYFFIKVLYCTLLYFCTLLYSISPFLTLKRASLRGFTCIKNTCEIKEF